MRKVVTGGVFALIAVLGVAGNVLAQGDAAAGEGKITVCLACHGASGNESQLPDVPKIGGQNERYLFKQLQEIKEGVRVAPLMAGMLATLNEQDMADVAAWYASQPAPAGAATADLVDLGEKIYRAGIAEVGVAACSACHSPSGQGNVPAGFPSLKGQDAAYTAMQLRAFRTGERQNDEASIMRALAARLSDAEISAVASYIAGLR